MTDLRPRPPRTSTRAWGPAAAALFAIGWGARPFVRVLVGSREHSGLSVGTVDALVGAYAVGLIPALLVLGPVSDRSGRAPVLRIAAIVSLAATAVLMVGSLWALYAGRLLAGIASGAAFAAGSAWVEELSAGGPHVPAGAGAPRGGAAGGDVADRRLRAGPGGRRPARAVGAGATGDRLRAAPARHRGGARPAVAGAGDGDRSGAVARAAGPLGRRARLPGPGRAGRAVGVRGGDGVDRRPAGPGDDGDGRLDGGVQRAHRRHHARHRLRRPAAGPATGRRGPPARGRGGARRGHGRPGGGRPGRGPGLPRAGRGRRGGAGRRVRVLPGGGAAADP